MSDQEQKYYFAHRKESRPNDYEDGDCFVTIEDLLNSYPETCLDEIEVIADSPLLNPLGGDDPIICPDQQAVEQAMDTLIEGIFWPQTLETGVNYSRRHDDTDGQDGIDQYLQVIISCDGDVWLPPHYDTTLRFRQDAGGGKSLRVRNAILVLAEAIRRDNEKCPQENYALLT